MLYKVLLHYDFAGWRLRLIRKLSLMLTIAV